MNKHIGTIVGIFIVATLIVMVSCNEKHPELNYPDSPLGLVQPPRPNELPTFEIPYALVREASAMRVSPRAENTNAVKDGLLPYSVAQDFLNNVKVSIRLTDQGSKTIDLKYQDINSPSASCTGTRVCTFRCGKTVYRITNIPDQCSCSYDDGEMMILCNEDCPSYELTCKTKTY